MIYLLDTNQDYDKCASELGASSEFVGQLITPLTRRKNRMRAHFGIDNGAFSRFDEKMFLNELRKQATFKSSCRFVAAPDIVSDWKATLESFVRWKDRLEEWPRCIVLQDGLQIKDIPWYEVEAIFIGGSNRFKDSDLVRESISVAKELGYWIHVGRVNGPYRCEKFESIACGYEKFSIDGTGIARYTKSRTDLVKHRNDKFLF